MGSALAKQTQRFLSRENQEGSALDPASRFGRHLWNCEKQQGGALAGTAIGSNRGHELAQFHVGERVAADYELEGFAVSQLQRVHRLVHRTYPETLPLEKRCNALGGLVVESHGEDRLVFFHR
jgi:hypothetical protein